MTEIPSRSPSTAAGNTSPTDSLISPVGSPPVLHAPHSHNPHTGGQLPVALSAAAEAKNEL